MRIISWVVYIAMAIFGSLILLKNGYQNRKELKGQARLAEAQGNS